MLDFSGPDMPAFKALGTNSSKFLKSTDLKNITAMIAPACDMVSVKAKINTATPQLKEWLY